jgi:hypothetical protein
MRNIKAGDLVMVVKPKPCGCADTIGTPFTVKRIEPHALIGKCKICGREWLNRGWLFFSDGANTGANSSMVIKIDPPALPESLEREKELSV